MKKLFTLGFLSLISYQTIHAQTSGGPDAYGYIWKDSNDPGGPTYSWIDIIPKGAAQVGSLADDNSVGNYALGFPFHFYWYDVTGYWIGSNGYLGFTSSQLSSPFTSIPSVAQPQNFLAAFGTDLLFDPGNAAQCYRWTSTGNDTLIVSWINVPFYDQSISTGVGSNTFQIILSTVDSSITYQYQTQSGFPATINSVIGIENNSGSIGLQHSFNVFPTSGYAIKFYYPTNTTYSVSDASTSYNDNPETAGIFLPKFGTSFVMNSNVKNTGNQTLASFNVNSKVLNNVGVTQCNDNLVVGPLSPGQSQNVSMTNTFYPATPGRYRYITTTQLSGDATPSNDAKTQEVTVIDTSLTSMTLSYDDGTPSAAGLSWIGGVGGTANYFIPPYYPCKVTDVLMYILSNVNNVGYTVLIFDDNGVGFYPGTLLDSISVLPGNVLASSWNTTTLSTPLIINSGGIYVEWKMDGVGITIGTNQVLPFSNRGFESLNGTWTMYRNREIEDLMINIKIGKLPGVGVEENSIEKYFGNFYPNPSGNLTTLNYSFPTEVKKLSYELYDLEGKQVKSEFISCVQQSGKINVFVNDLAAGIYTCKVIADGAVLNKKLVVTD